MEQKIQQINQTATFLEKTLTSQNSSNTTTATTNKNAQQNGVAAVNNTQAQNQLPAINYKFAHTLQQFKSNDDRVFFIKEEDGKLPPGVSVLAVLDGHGAQRQADDKCVDWAVRLLPELIAANFKTANGASYKSVLKNAFEAFNQKLKQWNEDEIASKDDRRQITSGSTITLAVIVRNVAPGSTQQTRVYVYNLGDSRAVLYKQSGAQDAKYEVVAKTRDHSGSDSEEQKRCIEFSKIEQRLFRKNRLGGELEVTRSLGDLNLIELGLSIDPEEYELAVERNAYLVMCTDGIWKTCSEQDVALILNEYAQKDPDEQLCERIRDLARQRQEDDDIGVVAIRFF